MRSTLIYDLPTRLFHWIFAGLFLFSFIVAKTIDSESLVFSYHMLSGLLLGLLVLWRILWGFIGSKHARFTGFDLNPLHLKDYLLGIINGSKKRWAGHNPASSWAGIFMIILALGLSTTGYLMSIGYKEDLEDIHEIMANTFIVIVIFHVAGVILHMILHRDAIALSMLDGKKATFELGSEIKTSRPFSALVLLLLMTVGGLYLYKNFNSQKRTLNLFGQTLQLGESDDEGEHSKNSNIEVQQEENTSNIPTQKNRSDEDGDDD